MPGYASRKALIDENKELAAKVDKLESEDVVDDPTTYKVINNPQKEIPTLRFKCMCCAEVEIKTLSYNLPLCAHCHRPMTRLKTWTS